MAHLTIDPDHTKRTIAVISSKGEKKSHSFEKPSTFEVLLFLNARRGEILAGEDIARGTQYPLREIRAVMTRLKGDLEELGLLWLETVAGKGYRFGSSEPPDYGLTVSSKGHGSLRVGEMVVLLSPYMAKIFRVLQENVADYLGVEEILQRADIPSSRDPKRVMREMRQRFVDGDLGHLLRSEADGNRYGFFPSETPDVGGGQSTDEVAPIIAPTTPLYIEEGEYKAGWNRRRIAKIPVPRDYGNSAYEVPKITLTEPLESLRNGGC